MVIERKLGAFTWGFNTEGEANLAVAMWEVAEAQGMDINAFRYVFGATLRMLGEGESPWAKFGVK